MSHVPAGVGSMQLQARALTLALFLERSLEAGLCPMQGLARGSALSLSSCATKLSLQAEPRYSFTVTDNRSTFKNSVVNLAF